MSYLLQFLIVLFFFIFTPTNTENIIYLNCNKWDSSINGNNFTDLIWNDILHTSAHNIFVDYGNCGIENIEENALVNYDNLKYISLEHNNIQALKLNTFINNNKLTVLKLNNNNLTKLQNFVFQNLTNVQRLYLDENEIKVIETKVFKNMSSLVILHLEGNKIEFLDNDIFSSNQEIEYLNLKHNQIIVLNTIKLRTNLKKLLNGNFLFDLNSNINNKIVIYCVGSNLIILILTSLFILLFVKYRIQKKDPIYYDEVMNKEPSTLFESRDTSMYIQVNSIYDGTDDTASNVSNIK